MTALSFDSRSSDSIYAAVSRLRAVIEEDYIYDPPESARREGLVSRATVLLEEAAYLLGQACRLEPEDDDGQAERDAYDERRVDERLEQLAREAV